MERTLFSDNLLNLGLMTAEGIPPVHAGEEPVPVIPPVVPSVATPATLPVTGGDAATGAVEKPATLVDGSPVPEVDRYTPPPTDPSLARYPGAPIDTSTEHAGPTYEDTKSTMMGSTGKPAPAPKSDYHVETKTTVQSDGSVSYSLGKSKTGLETVFDLSSDGQVLSLRSDKTPTDVTQNRLAEIAQTRITGYSGSDWPEARRAALYEYLDRTYGADTVTQANFLWQGQMPEELSSPEAYAAFRIQDLPDMTFPMSPEDRQEYGTDCRGATKAHAQEWITRIGNRSQQWNTAVNMGNPAKAGDLKTVYSTSRRATGKTDAADGSGRTSEEFITDILTRAEDDDEATAPVLILNQDEVLARYHDSKTLWENLYQKREHDLTQRCSLGRDAFGTAAREALQNHQPVADGKDPALWHIGRQQAISSELAAIDAEIAGSSSPEDIAALEQVRADLQAQYDSSETAGGGLRSSTEELQSFRDSIDTWEQELGIALNNGQVHNAEQLLNIPRDLLHHVKGELPETQLEQDRVNIKLSSEGRKRRQENNPFAQAMGGVAAFGENANKPLQMIQNFAQSATSIAGVWNGLREAVKPPESSFDASKTTAGATPRLAALTERKGKKGDAAKAVTDARTQASQGKKTGETQTRQDAAFKGYDREEDGKQGIAARQEAKKGKEGENRAALARAEQEETDDDRKKRNFTKHFA